MLPVISDPESLNTISSGPPDETGSNLDLLADRRRRAVLRYLADCEGAAPLSDLADHMTLEAEREPRGTIAECGDALLGTRRRVRISLRHVDVPKLAAADAVDFDLDENTVSLRERGATLLERADALEDDGIDDPAADAGPRGRKRQTH